MNDKELWDQERDERNIRPGIRCYRRLVKKKIREMKQQRERQQQMECVLDNRGLEKINGVNNFQIHKPINGNEGI